MHEEMMMNDDNVESSLLMLYIFLIYVLANHSVLLQATFHRQINKLLLEI